MVLAYRESTWGHLEYNYLNAALNLIIALAVLSLAVFISERLTLRFFRIHLSTLCVLIIVAGALLGANMIPWWKIEWPGENIVIYLYGWPFTFNSDWQKNGISCGCIMAATDTTTNFGFFEIKQNVDDCRMSVFWLICDMITAIFILSCLNIVLERRWRTEKTRVKVQLEAESEKTQPEK